MSIPESAMQWLASGERGLSSNAIFTKMTGIKTAKCAFEEGFFPLDPDGLTRCVKLLEAVPEFAPRIGEMADVSPEWAALVAHWDELVALLDSEVPGWREHRHGNASKTYARMRKLIESAGA